MIAYPPEKQIIDPGLRILCIKWGDKYSDEYVLKLKAACERYIPHREFICITENPVAGVDCNPLVCDLPGWWQKCGLFQPGLFPGHNLFLDLDVVITGGINPLIALSKADKQNLWVADDFSYSVVGRKPGEVGGHRQGTIQSSVMLWNGNPGSAVYRVWEQWDDSIMDELHGDQNHITRCLWPGGIKLFPLDGYVGSYKYGKGQKYPITVFHGDPKPADIKDGWVPEAWAA